MPPPPSSPSCMNMNMMSSGVVVVELGSEPSRVQNEIPSAGGTSKLATETKTKMTTNVENAMVLKRMKRWVVSSSSSSSEGGSSKMLERMKRWTVRMHGMVWKVGKEDPRRVVHSIKVGLSLTLLSLICLLEPLFQGIGQNSIWAVLTVILIFEFTAGTNIIPSSFIHLLELFFAVDRMTHYMMAMTHESRRLGWPLID